MRNLIIYILLFTLSFQTLASTYPQKSITSVMEKYDYLLTAHPQAHEEAFAKDKLERFKAELSTLTKTMTKAELAQELEILLDKVPTKKQRDAFRKLLVNSTPEELTKFFASPKLLQAALVGESANFAMNWEENGAVYGLLILMAVGVVFLILDVIKHAKYEFFTARSGPPCHELSSVEENDLLRQALRKCRDNAINPETCERSDFGNNGSSGTDEDGFAYDDRYCEAEYRALKKIK